jgi:ATP-binding cassette subfamily F protein uup
LSVLRLQQVSLHFGDQVLLDGADLQLEAGERVCLVGRNGAGKSTLLRLLEGEIRPDSGEVWRAPELRLARLAQEPQVVPGRTVYDEVASGLAGLAELLSQYHALTHAAGEVDLRRLEQLQRQLETAGGWLFQQRIDTVLTKLALPADTLLSQLSGGWLRRVALARALVIEPQLLLLDEPTNHLDLETIEWLETQLLDYRGALLFVTHDRALARRLSTRVVELDRGHLISYSGSYDRFVEQREQRLMVEERDNALFDKKLAAEEVWIRQGIKARRTRNEGRVRALKRLRDERSQRRELQGKASFSLESAERSGRLVADLHDVSYAIGGKRLIDHLDLTILRGDRIGLIGPNGAGKSTLLKLILGELQPDSGRVRRGERLQVAYFDQLRDRFDPEASLIDIVGEGREFIEIGGRRRHVISYLEDFLFRPDQARRAASKLSGGERARLQLARLFSQPVNLLVLDEPTNDLDVESLELLEQLLADFDGTILLVSHDRDFLDNAATSTLVFEGEGRIREYVGGYSDWLRQRRAPVAPKPAAAKSELPKSEVPKRAQKLSYKLQRELEELPARIEALEAELAQLNEEISGADFYQRDNRRAEQVLARLSEAQQQLDECYERWLALSER